MLIDELGKMELVSEAFRAAVSQLLEQPITLVALVHLARHSFTDAPKRRPAVELVPVTVRNRDAPPGRPAARLGLDAVAG